MSHIIVIDRKGIVIGTWKPGCPVALKCNERIDIAPTGAWMANGKLLNLDAKQREALIVKGRVVVRA